MNNRKNPKKQFEKELNKLINRRIFSILQLANIKRAGANPSFSKNNLKKAKAKLADLLIEIHNSDLQKRHKILYKKVCGHDVIPNVRSTNKRKFFKNWFDDQFGKSKVQNFIYVLKKDDLPVYVGRTQNGRGRPDQHFKSRMGFNKIDILPSGRRDIVANECALIHLYHPKYNAIKSGNIKHASKCPVCKKINEMNKHLDWMFNKK